MTNASAAEFVDALDVVAIRHGDNRVTRAHREALKHAAQRRTFNQAGSAVRMNMPTDEEFQRARALLSIEIRALMVAQRVVKGTFPGRFPNESDEACRRRLQHEVETNEELWRNAILTGATFPVPTWVTSAIAQDEGWQPGPGHLKGSPSVPGAERVHIEGWSDSDGEHKLFVLYPEATDRGRGPLEIGSTGLVARDTVRLSCWRVRKGWVTSRKMPSAIGSTPDPMFYEDGSAGPAPKPPWG